MSGYCELPPRSYQPYRYGPYDYPERTMYECECNEQLGAMRRMPHMVQLTQAGPGPVASTAVGVGLGAAYGAAIGAVAGGRGRRGHGALVGAATGAAINLVMNIAGIVFFTKD